MEVYRQSCCRLASRGETSTEESGNNGEDRREEEISLQPTVVLGIFVYILRKLFARRGTQFPPEEAADQAETDEAVETDDSDADHLMRVSISDTASAIMDPG